MTHLFKKLALSAAVATMASAPAFADHHRYEITLGGVYQKFDDDRNVDNDVGYAAGLGFVINPEWTVEAMWSDIETEDDDTGGDVDAQEYRLDFLYHLGKGDKSFRPFFVAGVGHMDFDGDSDSEIDHDETRINFGMGLKKTLSDRFDLRGDMRAFHGLDDNDTDIGFLLALTYKFGEGNWPEDEPEPVVEEVVAVDSDGDGVMDDDDLCPGTSKALAVDVTGCPIPVVETIMVNMNVNFATNSTEVTDEYRPQIEELATFMQRFEDTEVEIEGHTDSTGPAEYNQNLSQRRAEAVAQVLVDEYGVDQSRLNAVGYGEESPIADNSTPEGRAENRRVIAEISVEEESMQPRN